MKVLQRAATRGYTSGRRVRDDALAGRERKTGSKVNGNMRQIARALAFFTALVICAALMGTSGAGGATSGSPAAGVASRSADTPAVASPDTNTLENMSACQTILSMAAQSTGVNVRVSIGRFNDEVAGIDRSGCTITIGGTWSALGGGPSALDTISNALADRGWRDDPRYAEDTPGGTRFALVHRGAICIFQGFWDAGNPSDSTYVPSDDYTFVIRCAIPHP
jgi:hypothetical protein